MQYVLYELDHTNGLNGDCSCALADFLYDIADNGKNNLKGDVKWQMRNLVK